MCGRDDGGEYGYHAKGRERVKRAEELGYFKFGGSTILLLFEPGVVKFDDDLVGNSNAALETLVCYLNPLLLIFSNTD